MLCLPEISSRDGDACCQHGLGETLSFAGYAPCFNEVLQNLLSCRFSDCIVEIVGDICSRVWAILFAEVREDLVGS
jgi:hypothetical protein